MPSATGLVYDLDYSLNSNWCQVLLDSGLVGYVRETALLLPLEAAFKLQSPVTVEHNSETPARIQRVELRRPLPLPPPGSGLHYVVETTIDEADGRCAAKVFSASGTSDVFTRDLRMVSILVAALLEGWKVGYLAFDAVTGEITRGKLNISDQ